MVIGIPTQSPLAAVELAERLRNFAHAVEAGRDDECLVLIDISTGRMKGAIQIVAEWAESWSQGEVEVLVGRRTYILRAHKGLLSWIDLDRPDTPDLFRDLEP